MVTIIFVDFLVFNMPHDPAPQGDPYYECIDCGRRVRGDVTSRLCSECGGYLRNIGVPRQQ